MLFGSVAGMTLLDCEKQSSRKKIPDLIQGNGFFIAINVTPSHHLCLQPMTHYMQYKSSLEKRGENGQKGFFEGIGDGARIPFVQLNEC